MRASVFKLSVVKLVSKAPSVRTLLAVQLAAIRSNYRAENLRRFLQQYVCLGRNMQMKQMNRLERFQRIITSTSERPLERLQRISDYIVTVSRFPVCTDRALDKFETCCKSETSKIKCAYRNLNDYSCKLLSNFSSTHDCFPKPALLLICSGYGWIYMDMNGYP